MVINLVDVWNQGMKLGFWLVQPSISCPAVLAY
jgi:hypothetical protein